MALIELQNVNFPFHGGGGLSDVSLKIERAGFVAVLGGNGAGKSTLAKILNALISPTSGRILVDGREEKDAYAIRRKVGLVLQDPDSQMVADTVEDDVAFGPENLGLEPEDIESRVRESLQICGIKELAGRSPSRLSGGQKQLVAIAGAIAMHPDCLVLDEATSMLDPEGRRMVLSAIGRLNGNGMSVVMMTHDPEEAALAKSVVVLDHGRVVLEGLPCDVFGAENGLDEFGVDIPMVYKLRKALKNSGVFLDKDIDTMDKIVKELERRRNGC
ncbi:MAG: ATP-binding cassette domain-containing protein [Spirochaetales bacterium]|nr:ATP-binding cassette domain-containing protein [Spirochaetales bacterium]